MRLALPLAARGWRGSGRRRAVLGRGALLAVLTATLALGAVACGGEQEAAAPETEPAATEVSETETATEEELPGDPARGKQTFQAQGCGTCHTFEAADTTATIGPDLDERLPASTEKAGQPLREFIRESIVEPDAVIAEGFSPGVMPQDFGEKLSDEQLDDLVAFIVANVAAPDRPKPGAHRRGSSAP